MKKQPLTKPPVKKIVEAQARRRDKRMRAKWPRRAYAKG